MSMTLATINPYPDYPYSDETTGFIGWLGTNYGDAELIRVDETDVKQFKYEQWIGAINIEMQDIIDGM